MAKLFLIPTSLSVTINENVILGYQINSIKHLKYFIVETIKIGRAHLKHLNLHLPVQELMINALNKNNTNYSELIKPLLENNDVGLLSDCGLPAVADPGGKIVAMAHELNIEVVPLIGPSSILIALMSSGVNGQSFAFNGYLPIDKQDKVTKILFMQQKIFKENQSQIFIEAPFRNQALFETLLNVLDSKLILSIAINIMCQNQQILTKTIDNWKKSIQPNLNKMEVVFTLGMF